MAPAPALTKISTMGRKWSTPKITDSATAPAAAASAKSHVGAGGAREITPIAFMAASGVRRPDSTSSIARTRERAERATETLRGSHRAIRGLYVDEQCPSEGEDKIATLIGHHESFSRSMRLDTCAPGSAGSHAV